MLVYLLSLLMLLDMSRSSFVDEYNVHILIKAERQLRERLQTLVSMTLPADHYIDQLKKSDNETILQILTNRSAYFFNDIAVMAYLLKYQCGEYLMTKISPIVHNQETNNICIVNSQNLNKAIKIGVFYFNHFHKLYRLYGYYRPQQLIPKIEDQIMKCKMLVKQKGRQVNNFKYNIVEVVQTKQNTQYNKILMNKIQQYVNCFNYEAAEMFVESFYQFIGLLEQEIQNYEQQNTYLQFGLSNGTCPSYQYLQDQGKAGQFCLKLFQQTSLFIIKNLSQYQYYRKLKLPVKAVIKIMRTSNKVQQFNEKYYPKMKQYVQQIGVQAATLRPFLDLYSEKLQNQNSFYRNINFSFVKLGEMIKKRVFNFKSVEFIDVDD